MEDYSNVSLVFNLYSKIEGEQKVNSYRSKSLGMAILKMFSKLINEYNARFDPNDHTISVVTWDIISGVNFTTNYLFDLDVNLIIRDVSTIRNKKGCEIATEKGVPKDKYLRELFKNYYVFNPNTIKTCLSHCLALNQMKDKDLTFTTFSNITKLAKQIAKQYDISQGIITDQLLDVIEDSQNVDIIYFEELYDVDLECLEYFILISGEHALYLLNKEYKNANQLFNIYDPLDIQYKQLIKPVKLSKQLVENIGLFTYDFEWTHKSNNTDLDYSYIYLFGLYDGQN